MAHKKLHIYSYDYSVEPVFSNFIYKRVRVQIQELNDEHEEVGLPYFETIHLRRDMDMRPDPMNRLSGYYIEPVFEDNARLREGGKFVYDVTDHLHAGTRHALA